MNQSIVCRPFLASFRRCLRCVAIIALRAELVVAEDNFCAAPHELRADRGAAAVQRWKRCFYHEMAVRAALAAIVDFELDE